MSWDCRTRIRSQGCLKITFRPQVLSCFFKPSVMLSCKASYHQPLPKQEGHTCLITLTSDNVYVSSLRL